MPFRPYASGSFTETGIRSGAPSARGVYGILDYLKRPIYVGMSSYDVQERLLRHLQNRCIRRHRPFSFVVEFTDYPYSREAQLIREYRPKCNKA